MKNRKNAKSTGNGGNEVAQHSGQQGTDGSQTEAGTSTATLPEGLAPLVSESPLGPSGATATMLPPGASLSHDPAFDIAGIPDSVLLANKHNEATKAIIDRLLADKRQTETEMGNRLKAINAALRLAGVEVDDDRPVRTGRGGRPKGSKNAPKTPVEGKIDMRTKEGRALRAQQQAGGKGKAKTVATAGGKRGRKSGGDSKTSKVYAILKSFGKKGAESGDITEKAKAEGLSSSDVSQSLQALRRAKPPRATKTPEDGRGGTYNAL